MFRILLASSAVPVCPRHAVAAAVLHLAILLGAVRLAGSAPPIFRPVARDTIRMAINPLQPDPLRAHPKHPSPVLPRAAPILPIPQLPPVPRVDGQFSPRLAVRSELGRRELVPQSPGEIGSLPSAEPFAAAEVDQLPQVRNLNPAYPEALRRAGIGGQVVLEYVVLPNGRADSASVRVIASTEAALTMTVIVSVLRASFKPARRSGKAVPVLVPQTIRFRKR